MKYLHMQINYYNVHYYNNKSPNSVLKIEKRSTTTSHVDNGYKRDNYQQHNGRELSSTVLQKHLALQLLRLQQLPLHSY